MNANYYITITKEDDPVLELRTPGNYQPFFNGIGMDDYYITKHPDDIYTYLIRYSYSQRGKVYICHDESIISAIVSECVSQNKLQWDKFSLGCDYIYIFVDNLTRRCRYCLPNVIVQHNERNKTIKESVMATFCFSNAVTRIDLVYEAGQNMEIESPRAAKVVTTDTGDKFSYNGADIDTHYSNKNHYSCYFEGLLGKLNTKEISFDYWVNRSTEGHIYPVVRVVFYADKEWKCSADLL